MFDVFGLVTDTANDYLAPDAAKLFPVADRVILDSRLGAGARHNDMVMVDATPVTLEHHVYCVLRIDDAAEKERPSNFVAGWIVPAVRAVAEGFRELTQDVEVIAVRPGPLLGHVHGGGYLNVNGVDLRWLIDYDAMTLGDRLHIDMYVGTAVELKQPERNLR